MKRMNYGAAKYHSAAGIHELQAVFGGSEQVCYVCEFDLGKETINYHFTDVCSGRAKLFRHIFSLDNLAKSTAIIGPIHASLFSCGFATNRTTNLQFYHLTQLKKHYFMIPLVNIVRLLDEHGILFAETQFQLCDNDGKRLYRK